LQLRQQYNQNSSEHNGDLNSITVGLPRPLTLSARRAALLVLTPPLVIAENEIENRDHCSCALDALDQARSRGPHDDPLLR
jgi:hypothetical protein